ncbi:hypothetical protein ES708_29139 [subsurface metagenome]
MPSQNIRYLEKRKLGGEEDKEYCSIIERNDQNTFGANIYTLLADTFYMENGFAGEFAQKKINQILDDLLPDSNSTLEKKDRKDILFKIELIGEPVIREKLLEMYNNQKKETSIEEQIKLKENELELLRKRLKK